MLNESDRILVDAPSDVIHNAPVKRRQRFALLLVVLLLIMASPARGADPFEVYAVASLTGPGAYVGRGVSLALSAAEQYVNATGGIKGRPLKFVILDDQTNPATAVQLANQLIAKRVGVFLGPDVAGPCGAVLPLVRATGPVSYCLTNAIQPPAGSYMFSAQLSLKDFTSASFHYLLARKVTRIALLTSTDASGQTGEAVALENLRSPEFADLKLTANEHFAVSDVSVNAQIARIKASGAQVIDAWTTGPPFGTVLHGLQDAGWTGVVMTNGANINKDQMTGYASFIPNELILTGPPYMAVEGISRAVQAAKTRYLEQMHRVGVDSPDLTQMLAWDPALIVVDALRHLGTDATAAQVRDYVLNLHGFTGVNGIYDFRRGDQRGLDPRTSVVVAWDKKRDRFVTVSRPGGAPLPVTVINGS